MTLYWLGTESDTDFPPVEQALTEPNGLLAAGGDLSRQRLLAAYQRGIFPWYGDGQPILWWSPDPRMVLRPTDFHCSRSLKRHVRKHPIRITCNVAFSLVMDHCAAPRDGEDGTWITHEMKDAYVDLHQSGWAHSLEIWSGDEITGGIYGIAIGNVFFGESMFSAQTNGSKMALMALCHLLAADHFELLDCQMHTAHLQSLGAKLWSRETFSQAVETGAATLKRWQPPASITRELLLAAC
ncbi:MAG: leucyl/phenylalanyl-tRNA--protein transferase [Woeseiaceae bacterium]